MANNSATNTCDLCKRDRGVTERPIIGKFDGCDYIGRYTLCAGCEGGMPQDERTGVEETAEEGSTDGEASTDRDFTRVSLPARSIPDEEMHETISDLKLSNSVPYWIGKYEESKSTQTQLRQQSMVSSGESVGAGSTIYQGSNVDGEAVSAALAAATGVLGALGLLISALITSTPLTTLITVLGISVSIGSYIYYRMSKNSDESQPSGPQPFSHQQR
jgi:hypothetical protein